MSGPGKPPAGWTYREGPRGKWHYPPVSLGNVREEAYHLVLMRYTVDPASGQRQYGKPLARCGPHQGKGLVFSLVDRSVASRRAARLLNDLAFTSPGKDPWEYARYHVETMANQSANPTWVRVHPGRRRGPARRR